MDSSEKLRIFNIYVMQGEIGKDEGEIVPEENQNHREYVIKTLNGGAGPNCCLGYYNELKEVIEFMRDEIGTEKTPQGVVIVSKPEPYFYGGLNLSENNLSGEQRGYLENSPITGFIELDNETESHGIARKLTEEEMNCFTLKLKERLLMVD